MDSIKEMIVKKSLLNKMEDYINDLGEEEKAKLETQKEDIVNLLMKGSFKDLGGLVAMRGFVYQYYVAIYYIVSMLYSKQTNWWDSVVLEYFDDIALTGENKIRFIQVKTVKENSTNKHIPSDFTTRKKLVNPTSNIERFNSWVEKNILNFDYFLKDAQEEGINKNMYVPEFEIVTNSYSASLQDISYYTLNTKFNNNEEVSAEDKFKNAILKPINIEGNQEINFTDVALKDLEFYLEKLYVNKLGSLNDLQSNILNVISETVNINDLRGPSINAYILEKLFSYVIQKAHDDNEEKLDKEKLVITKKEIIELIEFWTIQAKEEITETSYYDTAVGLFRRTLINLEHDYNNEFANQNLKNELIENLKWFSSIVYSNLRTNPTYCITFLNRLFNTNNSLTIWDLSRPENELFLKNSISNIIYFLVFYSQKKPDYEEAHMIFHTGDSEIIENILFTLYHGRDKVSLIEAQNKVVMSINDCEISKTIKTELYCLVIGSKKTGNTPRTSKIAAKFKTSQVTQVQPKIIDVPDNIRFINNEYIEDFFNEFKEEGFEIFSFQDEELLEAWNEYVKEVIFRKEVESVEN